MPVLWWSWALRWFSPRYCLWTSCLCQMPGCGGSPLSGPGGSGHSAFAPVIEYIHWNQWHFMWTTRSMRSLRNKMQTCSLFYLKDAPKGPGAQMVQYWVTVDDFKGRSVLVHSLDALFQTVKLFFLHYKKHNTPSIFSQKITLRVNFILFINIYFNFAAQNQLNEQTDPFRSCSLTL